jgi:hypothetical protein
VFDTALANSDLPVMSAELPVGSQIAQAALEYASIQALA